MANIGINFNNDNNEKLLFPVFIPNTLIVLVITSYIDLSFLVTV